jgi:hypothetical protein
MRVAFALDVGKVPMIRVFPNFRQRIMENLNPIACDLALRTV